MPGRSRAFTFAALAVAAAGTLVCVVAIYRTAQLPPGDGTGMQWVILGPLAFLFFLVVVPAFVIGVNGLRAQLAAGEAGGGWRDLPPRIARQEKRTIRIVLISVAVIWFTLGTLVPLALIAFGFG